MKCPKCDVTLLLAERQDVEIDYCPECRGVWLDRGELDKIIERVGGQEQPAPPQAAAQVGQRHPHNTPCGEQPMPPGFGHHPQQSHHLLVNTSNDAWFAETSAPLQHLQLAALRAIEQGRWMVRGTNTGISAFIDPLGCIRLAGPQYADVAAVGQVHLRTEPTVFHRLYWALIAAAGLLAALFAYLVIRGNRHSHACRS